MIVTIASGMMIWKMFYQTGGKSVGGGARCDVYALRLLLRGTCLIPLCACVRWQPLMFCAGSRGAFSDTNVVGSYCNSTEAGARFVLIGS